jgi:hypothetical protein
MVDKKKIGRRGFLHKAWDVTKTTGLVAASAAAFGIKEHMEVGQNIGNPIMSVDYPTLQESGDELTPPKLIWKRAPTQEVLEGGNERNQFVVSNEQVQTIKPGENWNEILVLNEKFGHKTIEGVGFLDNAAEAPYNVLVFDYKMLAAFDHAVVEQVGADVHLRFVKDRDGFPDEKSPTITLKDQLTVKTQTPFISNIGNPTLSKIAITSPDNRKAIGYNEFKLNSVYGIEKALDKALKDAKMIESAERRAREDKLSNPPPVVEKNDKDKPINFETVTQAFEEVAASIKKKIDANKAVSPEDTDKAKPAEPEDALKTEMKSAISTYRSALGALINEHNEHVQDVTKDSRQRLSGTRGVVGRM